MPIIACPSCKGKLQFPEDSPPRRVKCPTCGQVFMSDAGADMAAPAAPGSVGSRAPRSDFEYDDDRPSRRRDDDDRRGRRGPDDDDDRRPRRSRYDVDEDDRPRGRRRDDVDDDDRRGRRRRRDEEDDYDDRDRRRERYNERAIEGQFNRASLACLLCFIAGWLQVGGLGVMVFYGLLAWAGLWEGVNVFRVIAGLLGLGGLLTAAVGYGFLVSGPRERGALGLSIATAAVGAFHLILVLLISTVQTQTVWGEQYTNVRWPSFVTEGNELADLIFLLISTKGLVASRSIMGVFANLAEIAQVVLFLLTLRAYARSARDPRRARMAMQALVANAIAAGAIVVCAILFGILNLAVRNERGGMDAVANIYRLLWVLTLAGVGVWTTLVIRSVKDSIDYRPD